MTTTPQLRAYALLLYPGFDILDAGGPLGVLNSLALADGNEGMTLSLIAKTMEPVSTSPPGGKGGPFLASQRWLPTHTFDTAPKIDVLLVPGGYGSLPPADTSAERAFMRKVYFGEGREKLKWLFTVCTGSGLAAEAGLLDNHRATSNKSIWKLITAYGPKTHWVGQARWVASGNIWTTSGVSAGTDGIIAWLAHVFGEDTAEYVTNATEWNREKDPANDPYGQLWGCEDVVPQSE